jgi:hypothetical protein
LESVSVTITARDIIAISIYLIALAGGLGTLHWRGMLKIAQISNAFDSRLIKVEEAVKELARVIHTNGLAKEKDLEKVQEDVQIIRRAIMALEQAR